MEIKKPALFRTVAFMAEEDSEQRKYAKRGPTFAQDGLSSYI